MKILISILFIIVTNSIFGQNFKNDSITNRFIKNLSASGVDTILIYEHACVDGLSTIVLENVDSCYYVGDPQSTYVIWKNKGLSYVNKFSTYNCYEYYPILYDFKLVWNLYFNNKTKIVKERILPPAYIEKGDKFTTDIDHYSFSQILIIDSKGKFEFEVNDFYITKMVDVNHVNMNYGKNIKTIRKKLQIQIESEIKYIEDNKLMKKRKRNL